MGYLNPFFITAFFAISVALALISPLIIQRVKLARSLGIRAPFRRKCTIRMRYQPLEYQQLAQSAFQRAIEAVLPIDETYATSLGMRREMLSLRQATFECINNYKFRLRTKYGCYYIIFLSFTDGIYVKCVSSLSAWPTGFLLFFMLLNAYFGDIWAKLLFLIALLLVLCCDLTCVATFAAHFAAYGEVILPPDKHPINRRSTVH